MHSDPQHRWKWFAAHEELRERTLENDRIKAYLLELSGWCESSIVTEVQFGKFGPEVQKVAEATEQSDSVPGGATRDAMQLMLYWSMDGCRRDEGPDWILDYLSRALDVMTAALPSPPAPRWREMADQLATAGSFNDRQQVYYDQTREMAAYLCDKIGYIHYDGTTSLSQANAEKIKEHLVVVLQGVRQNTLMDQVKYNLVTDIGMLRKYLRNYGTRWQQLCV